MLQELFSDKQNQASLTMEEAAELIHADPEALKAFEAAYNYQVLEPNVQTGNLFDQTKKSVAGAADGSSYLQQKSGEMLDPLFSRIVKELINQSILYDYDGEQGTIKQLSTEPFDPVASKEIYALPLELRPQMTGSMALKDLNGPPSYLHLLYLYQMYQDHRNEKIGMDYYHLFRQGLDILDLDPVMYQILEQNQNSMGHWLPALAEAVKDQDFFKIPKTKILKVPLPLLQMSRLEYGSLTKTTMKILDDYCFQVFDLKEDRDYFVKTGTYSSKFDFRNAHVHGAKEVRELGEYLLFIQNQAVCAAGPLSNPCIYGMSTTNEWVVREYIPDKENNPCIYKGLPLRTEIRVFLDFDSDEILGIAPYWDPNLMEKRFSEGATAGNPHDIHDYTVYLAHKDVLMERYRSCVGIVQEPLEKLTPLIPLKGQWSLDIMCSGSEYYLIDMALATQSALKECIPKGRLKQVEENWIPRLSTD